MTDDVPTWVWVATVAGLLGIVVIDLVVIGRRRRAVTMRDATTWVLIYVGLAMAFAVGLAVFAGPTAAGEFVAGYVTEYSLSVDNLFVFMIIMARFAVPVLAQDKVLYIGIVVSMVLRTVCIAAGAAAINNFNWVFYVFGAFLVYTAVKLADGRRERRGGLPGGTGAPAGPAGAAALDRLRRHPVRHAVRDEAACSPRWCSSSSRSAWPTSSSRWTRSPRSSG